MTDKNKDFEISVILPCRNERNTVGLCVKKLKNLLKEHDLTGEIIVVDNDSEDGSGKVASDMGAKVVRMKRPGYGYAIRAGLKASHGRALIISDCDTTYDMGQVIDLYKILENGACDMVIGNRFKGGFEPGAMSIIHKCGVRFLSWLGRLRFKTDVYDFHCGLRGMTRNACSKMKFRTGGMEFATEMIALASINGLETKQVPVRLRKCCYPRKSKLRTVRDGLRHLILIITYQTEKGR
ncbi:MAG: glycosyltransferase family 2 protein [Lachnospiraceae bacterium]|nr:glycosyltransferase family 2 protein [Lachnospiraceae bacterium]